MAGGKGDIIIIKKKKGGGGHGHHGGAWKVAYADFVTAMMCFFLVMWLMGSDEETKASISHYFNHPNTPYKAGADAYSTSQHPMGEKEGTGESVMHGMDGFYPEDLIDHPKPERDVLRENKTISQLVEDLLQGQVYGMDVSEDHVRFSLPDHLLFETGSAQLNAGAKKHLDLLGQVLRTFRGYIVIEGHTDNTGADRGSFNNNWQLSMGRAVSVMQYFASVHHLKSENMVPVGAGPRRALASNSTVEGRKKNRRVEFVLTYKQPE